MTSIQQILMAKTTYLSKEIVLVKEGTKEIVHVGKHPTSYETLKEGRKNYNGLLAVKSNELYNKCKAYADKKNKPAVDKRILKKMVKNTNIVTTKELSA